MIKYIKRAARQDLLELPKSQPLVALPHVFEAVGIVVLDIDIAMDPLLVELLAEVPG